MLIMRMCVRMFMFVFMCMTMRVLLRTCMRMLKLGRQQVTTPSTTGGISNIMATSFVAHGLRATIDHHVCAI